MGTLGPYPGVPIFCKALQTQLPLHTGMAHIRGSTVETLGFMVRLKPRAL